MSEGLTHEFQKFSKNVKHLRRLQRETLQSIEDVSKSGNLDPDQVREIGFSLEELAELQSVLERPPCFLILGQDCYGKVAVVTRLLGEQLLPVVPRLDPRTAWRTIRLRYATHRTVTLTLPPPLPQDSTYSAPPPPHPTPHPSSSTDGGGPWSNGRDGYELVTSLHAHSRPWGIVPRVDIEITQHGGETQEELEMSVAVLEVGLKHSLLREGTQIVLTPTYSPDYVLSRRPHRHIHHHHFHKDLDEGGGGGGEGRGGDEDEQVMNPYLEEELRVLLSLLPTVLPIVVYAISREALSEQDKESLRKLKRLAPDVPVLFVRVPRLPDSFSDDLPESEQHDILCKLSVLPSLRSETPSPAPQPPHSQPQSPADTVPVSLFRTLCDELGYLTMTPTPPKLRYRLLETNLRVDSELLDSFSGFASIVPYVRMILQAGLIRAATLLNNGHNRCMRMFILFAFDMAREIQITPRRLAYAREKEAELYDSLMAIAVSKQDEIRNVISQTIADMTDDLLEEAANYEFQEISVPEVGCLSSVRDLRICTGEIQELVVGALNGEVGKKLVGSVDVMRDSYLGTLQRCLESLEKECKASGDSPHVGDALKQMVNAAYQVEVTVTTSSSVLRSLWEKMKQIVATMPGRTPPVVDAEWKRKVAADMIDSLSEAKLTRSICAQFRERLKNSHESFLVHLKRLESEINSRLERTEEQQARLKKVDAPRLARYALESTSLKDMILFGMPRLDRELGRGQYGVVYGCESWGGYRPCAVKSLVPLDEKHWNDLAMEFNYTRSVPEHERIVALRGSVIDHSYGQGETPAVLLIMDRLARDLYSGIKNGIDWLTRLQIALDVSQGIRFLHSQGLVHRDIKLKNVLLDKNNRAKLTDLGFCKPEAMMSGSIVGTPIHMAPELFTGHYDNSVDVYAFGILFWYICAGHVRLPYVFEQCQSKDQLWNCVKKGARPERLTVFEEDCWCLMQECWAGDPNKRPLLGVVEPRLINVMDRFRKKELKKQKKKEQQQQTTYYMQDPGDDDKVDSAVDVVIEECAYLG